MDKLENLKESFAQLAFGRSRKGNQCVTCGSAAMNDSDFNDPISLKERDISRMCQVCQDEVFCDEDAYDEGPH